MTFSSWHQRGFHAHSGSCPVAHASLDIIFLAEGTDSVTVTINPCWSSWMYSFTKGTQSSTGDLFTAGSSWYLRVVSFYFVTCQIPPPVSTTVNGALVYPLASYIIAFIPLTFSDSSQATQVFITRCPFATKNVHSGHVPHGMGSALWLKACRVQGTCLARMHGKLAVCSLNDHAHTEWLRTVVRHVKRKRGALPPLHYLELVWVWKSETFWDIWSKNPDWMSFRREANVTVTSLPLRLMGISNFCELTHFAQRWVSVWSPSLVHF